ncbi:hypothetical protein EUX98_g7597 [Antrodiella citrinella]|uniref:Uncharacterized protein n=1 Tax=Antrodiella citrinella TaxID=2447956 RepID=A0A4S4MNH5_9APHY|nr:hypothetical protein EUX98_g7597 [Antrodiella citrinella]
MSSTSTRSYYHRRRSHSTSSSGSSRYITSGTWRASHKRSRPNNLLGPSYKDLSSKQPPEKWDVDMWRRGKRARMSLSSPSVFSGAHTVFPPEQASTGLPSTTFTCAFPSTSAAFQFFPGHSHNSFSTSAHASDASLDASMTQLIPRASVDQLRTDAFGELHRSVAESGEGLISRMRDWEVLSKSHHRRRSSSGQQQLPWTRKRSAPGQSWSVDAEESTSTDDELDDDDDIQIISGELSSPVVLSAEGSPSKERAFSLSVMDVDHPPYMNPDNSDRSSSPIDMQFSSISETYSDDDGEDGGSSPPALTHACTNSASSSLISLPLPPPYIPREAQAPSSEYNGPSTVSRTEKAIAALSLALANGAGGLNDYEALRMAEDKTSALDESLIGEMWH